MKSIVTGAAIVLGVCGCRFPHTTPLNPSHSHMSWVVPLHFKLSKLKFRDVVSSREGRIVSKGT